MKVASLIVIDSLIGFINGASAFSALLQTVCKENPWQLVKGREPEMDR